MQTMKKVNRIIYNDYHKTECVVIAQQCTCGDVINKQQYQRAWRKTCGVKGCMCRCNVVQLDRDNYIVF